MSEHVTPTTPEKKPVDLKKELLEWGKELLIAFVAFLIIHNFIFTMIRVDGRSMVETLQDNDRLAVTIIDMKLGGPARGDIVICTYPGEDHLCVKRVIGMPGEVIEIRNGVTFIDGEQLDEPYVEHSLNDEYAPYEIPAGHYFVMGDNRANSKDSRDSRVGALDKSAIGGKARMRVWPLNRFQIMD